MRLSGRAGALGSLWSLLLYVWGCSSARPSPLPGAGHCPWFWGRLMALPAWEEEGWILESWRKGFVPSGGAYPSYL